MKLTLLGTGCPTPSVRRRGPGQVIESADSLVLVDCGAGTMHRLLEAGYEGRPITHIAFTHLHSDHVTGLMDVLWAGWVRRNPPRIYGPPGTKHLIDCLVEGMVYDTRVRGGRNGAAPARVAEVEDFEEGWSIDGADWQLSNFRVEHLPVDQAFGFRFDGDGGSIAISGDTKPCDNLIAHAQGVDILVHEVFWAQGMARALDAAEGERQRAGIEVLRGYHTGSDVVGQIATSANARRLVLSHIFMGRIAGRMAPDDPDALLADSRPHFKGELTVGEDLMTFEI